MFVARTSSLLMHVLCIYGLTRDCKGLSHKIRRCGHISGFLIRYLLSRALMEIRDLQLSITPTASKEPCTYTDIVKGSLAFCAIMSLRKHWSVNYYLHPLTTKHPILFIQAYGSSLFSVGCLKGGRRPSHSDLPLIDPAENKINLSACMDSLSSYCLCMS